MDEKYSFLISCPPFCEDLLAEDCDFAGISDQNIGTGFLTGKAEYSSLLRIIFYSRIAGRVYVHLHNYKAENYDELYSGALSFPWQDHLSMDQNFSVSVQSKRTEKTDDRYALQRIKDALCDYFRSRTGQRPDVDTHRPDTPFYVFWNNSEANIYYDLSGQSLHRRSYRKTPGKADLKENLAAAIIRRSKWFENWRECPLADPFCGSGTLVIEAALMALGIPPGPMRNYYGFFGWKHHNQSEWDALINEDKKKDLLIKKKPFIWASDIDPYCLNQARENANNAGVESYIHFHKKDFFDFNSRSQIAKPGILVTNPPYGQRLESLQGMNAFYHLIGRQLKSQWENWHVKLLAPKELSLATGLKSSKGNRFNNGNINCQLSSFMIDESNRFNPLPHNPGIKKGLSSRFIDENQDILGNRLKKNKRMLKSWLKKKNVSCYRIYDADIPEYNAAIDIYENQWALIQEYQAPREIPEEKILSRLKSIIQQTESILEIKSADIFVKQRSRQKGKDQYSAQSHLGVYYTVCEGGLKFRVNFTDYLDTGIFLDHRDVRSIVQQLSHDKSVLNLFSYTGTVSCYALMGGARKVVNVDTSKKYLAWARENCLLNGFDTAFFSNHLGDCFDYLRNTKEKFDLVFCDPPTFSNSKSRSGEFIIQRDYGALVNFIKKILKPEGFVIFSCNFRDFKLNKEDLPFNHISNITKQTLPEDFRKNPKIHQVWIFHDRPLSIIQKIKE